MNTAALRIIDANANRAREGLRVLEDYARFALNDQLLCGNLKNLRHRLQSALQNIGPIALLHRDTPGDVGTQNKTSTELTRDTMADVVVAAGKRTAEAVRTLEEYLKLIDPAGSQMLENVRYSLYDIELNIARSLAPLKARFKSVGLYVLITESVCTLPWLEVATQVIDNGVDCIQLREKEMEGGELLKRAEQLVQLCAAKKVLCIINDRVDIALASGADGVHVGQGDLPAVECRKLLGLEKIVGVSTHEMGHAKKARLDGADYIGVGPVFTSTTKPRDFLPGLAYAKQASGVGIASIAIAGITLANVEQVLETGVSGIAVSSCVTRSSEPGDMAKQLKQKIERARKAAGV